MAHPRRTMKRNRIISHQGARAEHLREELRRRGISVAEFARGAGCSRQFAWQVLSGTVSASDTVLRRFETVLAQSINADLDPTIGRRLRRARRRAGLTLKETAAMIGYTWIAVERWEQNVCLPKPGVLLHLCQVYGEDASWIPFPGQHANVASRFAAQND
jgi:transcriptional regulator with XRE-family HTH domain